MELYTPYSEEPSPFAGPTREDTDGKRKPGAGSLATQTKVQYLLDVANQIASDIEQVVQSFESKETKILKELLKGNEKKAKKLVEDLTIAEIEKLRAAIVLLYTLCKVTMENR